VSAKYPETLPHEVSIAQLHRSYRTGEAAATEAFVRTPGYATPATGTTAKMVRRQSTFTLVPNPMGMQGLMTREAAGPPVGRPMTSKQVQAEYRKKDRMPKISKAEQRRLDREEADRMKRELEKERAANKARILRDKKKAKELAEIQTKKKRGLPLVDVRPSQDTIARFVRGNGGGRKRDSLGIVQKDEVEKENKIDNEDEIEVENEFEKQDDMEKESRIKGGDEIEMETEVEKESKIEKKDDKQNNKATEGGDDQVLAGKMFDDISDLDVLDELSDQQPAKRRKTTGRLTQGDVQDAAEREVTMMSTHSELAPAKDNKSSTRQDGIHTTGPTSPYAEKLETNKATLPKIAQETSPKITQNTSPKVAQGTSPKITRKTSPNRIETPCSPPNPPKLTTVISITSSFDFSLESDLIASFPSPCPGPAVPRSNKPPGIDTISTHALPAIIPASKPPERPNITTMSDTAETCHNPAVPSTHHHRAGGDLPNPQLSLSTTYPRLHPGSNPSKGRPAAVMLARSETSVPDDDGNCVMPGSTRNEPHQKAPHATETKTASVEGRTATGPNRSAHPQPPTYKAYKQSPAARKTAQHPHLASRGQSALASRPHTPQPAPVSKRAFAGPSTNPAARFLPAGPQPSRDKATRSIAPAFKTPAFKVPGAPRSHGPLSAPGRQFLSTKPSAPAFRTPPPRKPISGNAQPVKAAPPGVHSKSSNAASVAPSIPTSTQMFLMTHLDEILPTHSQEARELGLPVPEKKTSAPLKTQAPMPPPSRPAASAVRRPYQPPPRAKPAISRTSTTKAPIYAVSGPRSFKRQTAYASAARTPQPPRPLPRAAPPKPPVDNSCGPLPFFCTQDLIFSTQDSLEMQGDMSMPRAPLADVRREGHGQASHPLREITNVPVPQAVTTPLDADILDDFSFSIPDSPPFAAAAQPHQAHPAQKDGHRNDENAPPSIYKSTSKPRHPAVQSKVDPKTRQSFSTRSTPKHSIPSQHTLSGSNPSRQQSRNTASRNPVPRPQTIQKPAPPSHPVHDSQPRSSTGSSVGTSQQSSSSTPRRPFFTSSGTHALVRLAVHRSEQTFRDEETTRAVEERKREKEVERQQRLEENKRAGQEDTRTGTGREAHVDSESLSRIKDNLENPERLAPNQHTLDNNISVNGDELSIISQWTDYSDFGATQLLLDMEKWPWFAQSVGADLRYPAD
jgi:hypothetical protein